MQNVKIYTDGACSGNPGAGGYSAILICNGAIKEISGGNPNTTNNQMELMGVIAGLQALKKPCNVEVYSDSAYVVNAFTQCWLSKWAKNGWRTASKKPVLNAELWKMLIALNEKHCVSFNKVAGHSGDFYNERCDELARLAIIEKKWEDSI